MSSETVKAFGRYHLVERIAEGGMAEIFRAKAKGAHGFEKPLVIKRILPELAADESFVRMFIDEAKVTVQLSHPKVVQVLDFGREEGRYFIAMEYIKGIDCLALLRQCAHLRVRPTTGIAVHIAAEVLDALDYAHNLTDDDGRPLRILHRDISPSNIFISRLGEVKLGDFGIAVTAAHDAAAKRMKGKYGYMAPELVTGNPVDRRSDLFSVGVVLAELLMIRRLFIAKSELEVLLQVRDADLHRLRRYGKTIPRDLMTVLESALARDPEARYQDAATFRDALHRYLFDNRLMVHNNDVRRFLERLDVAEPGDRAVATQGAPQQREPTPEEVAEIPKTPETEYASQTGERVCVLSRAEVEGTQAEEEGGRQVLGHKRKIMLGPPPRPRPVPSSLPQTGEAPRIATDDALAAMPEVGDEGTGSAHDFRTRESDEQQIPMPSHTPSPPKPRHVAASRISGRVATLSPELSGDLGERSLVAVLFPLAVDEETGLIVLQSGEAVKEIYLVDGDPHFVASNLPEELFGQYLVQRGAITEGELAMALAMLPHFEGKLGSTLVGLGLLRPMEVLRYLTHQVRQKLVNAFGWERGRYSFYKGHQAEQEAAPLGLDAFEMIGAGVKALSVELVERRLAPVWSRRPKAVPGPVPPEVFRLGAETRAVFNKLDGRRTLGEMVEPYDDVEERGFFLRVAYLFIEAGLVVAD